MPFKILLFRCQLQSSSSSLITHRPESDQHLDLFAFLPACSGLGHHWSTAPALPLPRPYPAVPGPSSKTKALILAHPTRNRQRIDRCMTACSIIGPHSQLKLFQILWRSLNDPNGQLPNTVIRHSIRVVLALITHPHLVRCRCVPSSVYNVLRSDWPMPNLQTPNEKKTARVFQGCAQSKNHRRQGLQLVSVTGPHQALCLLKIFNYVGPLLVDSIVFWRPSHLPGVWTNSTQ